MNQKPLLRIIFGLLFLVGLYSTRLNLSIELNVDVGGIGSYDESPESRMMGNSITTIKISIEKLNYCQISS